MRLKISHRTLYSYDTPLSYGLQRLRLKPQNSPTQKVIDWKVKVTGAVEELRFLDHFGNDTRLLSLSNAVRTIEIVASGEVDVQDNAGIIGKHTGFAPLWLFENETPLTMAGPLVSQIAYSAEGENELDLLHKISNAIREKVTYTIGATETTTTAEDAAARGEGVCQDHSHIFLAAARKRGFPARYVSGYLKIDEVDEQVATHAWAEAHVSGLGWVAFDVSNGIAPDERYVRLAIGRDYRDAMPVSGIRVGRAQEQLEVLITVEQ